MRSKTYDEKLENYLRGLIEILMRKYSFSKKEAACIIMGSYVWPSFIEYPEESLHDDIGTVADNIYEEYTEKYESGEKNMRDPNRIYKFCNELATVWATNAPDLRFEQFVDVVHGAIEADGKDPFYLEEDEMMKYINKFKV